MLATPLSDRGANLAGLGVSQCAPLGGRAAWPHINPAVIGSGLTVTDFEQLMRPTKSGEIRCYGLRRVENLYSNTGYPLNTAGSGTNPPTVSVGASYLGKTCTSLVLPAGGAGVAFSQYVAVLNMYNNPVKFIGLQSIKLVLDRALTGLEAVWVDVVNGACSLILNAATPNVTVWQFMVGGFISLVSGTGNAMRVWVQHALSSPVTVYLAEMQYESVPLLQTNNAPASYVSSTESSAGAFGVKYLSALNGNTVSSNIVTEAVGLEIPPVARFTPRLGRRI